MVNAVNLEGLDGLWDPAAQPLFASKPPEWIATYLPRYCQSSSDRTESDCRGLALIVRELHRDGFWERLFPDWNSCCLALFKRPAAWVAQVVEGVRVLQAQGEEGPIPVARAVATANHALNLTGPFADPGNPHGNCDNITVRSQGNGGTSAAYLAARLKKAGRDDLLEQVGPKKLYRSIRAAAIEAGIIKPVPTVRLVADMAVVAGKLCQHLTQQQRIQLIDLLAPDL